MKRSVPSHVIGLRHRLGVERAAFARIAGVDNRTVVRWETGKAEPSGAPAAVLNGIREKLDSDPANAARVVAYIVDASAVGGLAYLILKLLDAAVPRAA
jgi:DNA-binding XRE family transcriptional regulator